MQKKLFNKTTKIVLLSCFVVCALLLSQDLITDEVLQLDKSMNRVLKILIKVEKSLEINTFKTIILFGFSYFLLDFQYNMKKRNNIFKIVLAVLFSVFMLFRI